MVMLTNNLNNSSLQSVNRIEEPLGIRRLISNQGIVHTWVRWQVTTQAWKGRKSKVIYIY
jgi:hypothetical protein